jgi:GT2 family glycosyltransferase
MISIITAIHNQLPVNQIFWEALSRYTKNTFELIVIDNASTDASADFFESVGARVIRNSVNYSYPFSQNQGINIATHDWLAFLNNDIIVSPSWDEGLIRTMDLNQLDVCTVCGIEQVENPQTTKALKRRWKAIKNLIGIVGRNGWQLRLMHRLMYQNWEKFCLQRRTKFAGCVKEGFVGNTVLMRRAAIQKIGLWDDRIQAADFDLYLRTVQRANEFGDIRPVHIALDVFVHHYIRLTLRSKYPGFADADRLMNLEEKWSPEYLKFLDH